MLQNAIYETLCLLQFVICETSFTLHIPSAGLICLIKNLYAGLFFVAKSNCEVSFLLHILICDTYAFVVENYMRGFLFVSYNFVEELIALHIEKTTTLLFRRF